jgi:putative salt-induced outer membrane protein YdiY
MRTTATTRSDQPPASPPFLRYLLPVVLGSLLTVATTAEAQTILNVERLQPGDVDGWHWGLEGEFSLSRGNTEYVDLFSGVVGGHRWTDHWLRLFVGLDYRSETGESLENDRYLHARYNRWLSERWQTFHFLQLQASRGNLLQRRTLFGSGIRHRLVDGRTTFDLGTGVMHERENLDQDRIVDDHPVQARVWRMANLFVATRQLSESLRLVGVAYVQPDLEDLEDLRTLTDLSLQIALTDNVDLTLRGEWRRDSRPPQGVRRSDVVFMTGFAFRVR